MLHMNIIDHPKDINETQREKLYIRDLIITPIILQQENIKD